MLIEQLTNVLGETRPVTRRYEDGSFDCPFCPYAVIVPATTCTNPWCTACPTMPVEAARKIEADHAAKLKAEADAKALRESIARTHALQAAERAKAKREAEAEAARRGACLACLWPRGEFSKPKFIVHRGRCPKSKI